MKDHVVMVVVVVIVVVVVDGRGDCSKGGSGVGQIL